MAINEADSTLIIGSRSVKAAVTTDGRTGDELAGSCI
jgi:hypothetical protein